MVTTLFTKALIVSIPDYGDNVYTVRIPLFENSTSGQSIYEALECAPPGVYSNYQPGDCVYVIFEDGQLVKPVIIGKLYTGNYDTSCGVIKTNTLSTTDKTYLNNIVYLNGANLSTTLSKISNSAIQMTGVEVEDPTYEEPIED